MHESETRQWEKKSNNNKKERTKERKGKEEQSEIMTGQIWVCVKKGGERETEGKKKIKKKLKISEVECKSFSPN